jgi:hypothetical protein
LNFLNQVFNLETNLSAFLPQGQQDSAEHSKSAPYHHEHASPYRILAHKSFWIIAIPWWIVCFFIGRWIAGLPKDRLFQINDISRIPAMILERLKDYRHKQKQKD